MRWLMLVAVVPWWQPLRPAWGPRREVRPAYRLRVPVVPGPVPVWVVPEGRGVPKDPWGRPIVPGPVWGWED